ncbi:MAG: CaiB/BaiF CoA-transferase family protein, partial [Pseudomonadota bacterium]
MTMPLSGIRVLELNRVAPGSFCTMMLGDMGAEVIKIETPPNPASTKHFDSKHEDVWVLSEFTNRNKKSITLNLKDPQAQKLLQELAKEADVLVEGFRPGVTARLGADYKTLSEINPRLIYCSLSGFGQDGPYAQKAAHDLNYLAIAGVLNQIGPADQQPPIPLNIIGDYGGATLHGVVGVLLALVARDATGRGQHVDVSYLDTSFALLAAVPGIRNFFIGEREPERGENVFAGAHPYYTVYPTKDDKWLSVGCMEPWLWDNFCDALERPDLKAFRMETDDFQQGASAQQQQIKTELDGIMRSKTRDEWVKFFGRFCDDV